VFLLANLVGCAGEPEPESAPTLNLAQEQEVETTSEQEQEYTDATITEEQIAPPYDRPTTEMRTIGVGTVGYGAPFTLVMHPRMIIEKFETIPVFELEGIEEHFGITSYLQNYTARGSRYIIYFGETGATNLEIALRGNTITSILLDAHDLFFLNPDIVFSDDLTCDSSPNSINPTIAISSREQISTEQIFDLVGNADGFWTAWRDGEYRSKIWVNRYATVRASIMEEDNWIPNASWFWPGTSASEWLEFWISEGLIER